jgi:hypothetical protein
MAENATSISPLQLVGEQPPDDERQRTSNTFRAFAARRELEGGNLWKRNSLTFTATVS